MKRNRRIAAWLLLACFILPETALAEEFSAEVLSVEGPASVKEGDVLPPGSVVETGPGGAVDLAYDKEFKNVSRVGENSKVTIKSVYPTGLSLAKGSLYAKLKDLPKESTFEVETPTAIASVRGSEYLTSCPDGGVTEIQNFEKSDVFVFGLDDGGNLSGEPLKLHTREKTSIERRGQTPRPPRRLEDADLKGGEKLRQGIQGNVERLVKAGRVGKVQDLGRVRKELAQRPREGLRRGERRMGGAQNFAASQDDRRNQANKRRKRRKRKPLESSGTTGGGGTFSGTTGGNTTTGGTTTGGEGSGP